MLYIRSPYENSWRSWTVHILAIHHWQNYAKVKTAVMTDMQLYIAAGLPTLAVLVGILMSVSLFNSLSARLLTLENKVDTKLDIVAGKLAGLDNRLSRVEERLSIH
jgi:hypothetical protein